MTLREKLRECRHSGNAVLAANFYNFETLEAVLLAAAATRSPVILQLTRSSIDYMGLEMAVAMARCGIERHGVEGWVHLDHGGSEELVRRCLDAGFDSVMIDASERPFEENIATTRRVVDMARSYGAGVEAELGYVAKLGQAQGGSFTSPRDAALFASSTGVDYLAVAIGSAHGFYKEAPRLDIERLGEIAAVVDIPLVLHGSSGIPADQLRSAIGCGIAKVNIATETKDTFMRALRGVMLESDEIDLRKVFPAAIHPAVEMLKGKFEIMRQQPI